MIYETLVAQEPDKWMYLYHDMASRPTADVFFSLVGKRLCLSLSMGSGRLWYHIPIPKLTCPKDIKACSEALFKVFDEWETW